MNCPMPSGSSSVLCCLGRSEGGSGRMTGRSSMGSSGSSVQARPGRTYRNGMDPGPRCTLASADGPRTAPSSGCSGKPRHGRMRPVRSTGWYRSTPPSCEPTSRRPEPERGLRNPALGRSRGGLTSKIHLVCDAVGRPLAFVLTGGNTNDCTQFTAVMEAIRVPRIGPGRPRVRPDHVLGDKGYSSKAIRAWLRRRGITHTIPERADQILSLIHRQRQWSIAKSTSSATLWNGASTA